MRQILHGADVLKQWCPGTVRRIRGVGTGCVRVGGYDGDDLSCGDAFPGGQGSDDFDHAGAWRRNDGFHLHRADDQQRIARCDANPRLGATFDHRAGDGAFNGALAGGDSESRLVRHSVRCDAPMQCRLPVK